MRFNIEDAKRSLVQRAEEARTHRETLARAAEADAQAIVAMLIRDYAPKRIYRWGSLLTPGQFREWSDIDIAVEGLYGPMTGLHALDAACQVTRFPVDLVELERIHPAHAETIRTTGRLVYERK